MDRPVEPTTELDPRFSEPGAVATTWAQALEVITKAEIFWLSTVRAGGRPHVTPLVAAWFEGALYFTTGGAEQKAINLFRNPQVALTAAGGRWDEGLDVVVEGSAVRVTDNDQLRRLAGAWSHKWDGRWRWEVGDSAFEDPDHGGEAFVFRVQPTKVLAFGQGTFTHTRHRF